MEIDEDINIEQFPYEELYKLSGDIKTRPLAINIVMDHFASFYFGPIIMDPGIAFEKQADILEKIEVSKINCSAVLYSLLSTTNSIKNNSKRFDFFVKAKQRLIELIGTERTIKLLKDLEY